METEQIRCTAEPQGTTYHFDLNCDIECPEQFEDFFTILRQAGPEDLVFIHINSAGGSLDTSVQIVNAIDGTQATVVTSAEGLVASGAACIFFSGHAFQIGKHCEFLIHTASGGHSGKINDTMTSVGFSIRRIKEFYEDVLGTFLTQEELDLVSRGEEFFLTSEEVTERINNVIEKEGEQVGDDGLETS